MPLNEKLDGLRSQSLVNVERPNYKIATRIDAKLAQKILSSQVERQKCNFGQTKMSPGCGSEGTENETRQN